MPKRCARCELCTMDMTESIAQVRPLGRIINIAVNAATPFVSLQGLL